MDISKELFTDGKFLYSLCLAIRNTCFSVLEWTYDHTTPAFHHKTCIDTLGPYFGEMAFLLLTGSAIYGLTHVRDYLSESVGFFKESQLLESSKDYDLYIIGGVMTWYLIFALGRMYR